MADILKTRKAGMTIDGEAEEVADVIQDLERDRAKCARLRQTGRRAVIDYFNWQRVDKETDAVLRAVAKREVAPFSRRPLLQSILQNQAR